MIKTTIDYFLDYEERASIIEFCGGFSRDEAEQGALKEILETYETDTGQSSEELKFSINTRRFSRVKTKGE